MLTEWVGVPVVLGRVRVPLLVRLWRGLPLAVTVGVSVGGLGVLVDVGLGVYEPRETESAREGERVGVGVQERVTVLIRVGR